MECEKEAEHYQHFIAVLTSEKYPKYRRQIWGDRILIKILRNQCLSSDIKVNLLRIYCALISDKSIRMGIDLNSLPLQKKERIKSELQILLC